MDRLLNVSELANALKVSKKTVYVLHEEGSMSGGINLTKRTIRFRPGDVLRWLNQHTTTGPIKRLELLSPGEAAECLGIRKKHLYELVRQKIINGVKIGRLVRIPTEEIERLTGAMTHKNPGYVKKLGM